MVSIAAFQAVDPGSIPGRRNFFSHTMPTHHLSHTDEVAEWLRRWTANPMGSARVGSNPILVDCFSRSTFWLWLWFPAAIMRWDTSCENGETKYSHLRYLASVAQSASAFGC